MLKDIIRSIEYRINELEKAKLYAQTELIAFKKILPDLKKEAELQEEMINAFKEIKYQTNLVCYDQELCKKIQNIWEAIYKFEEIIKQ
jgi:hypothetical protein